MISVRASMKGLVAALGLAGLASSATAAECDRACLQGLADKLLDSAVAHAPDKLPLTQTYAATENSVPAALNMMVLWRTAQSATNRYYAIDPVSQQVFFEASVSEGGANAFVWGRLKADGGKIAEIEIYENRARGQGGFQFGPEAGANLPEEWTKTVPAARLPNRAQLLTYGKAIFDTAYDAGTASPDCVLMENGKVVEEHADVAAAVASGGKGEAPKGKAFVRNANGTVPIPCGSPPGRPTDSRARTDIVDEAQGVVVTFAVVSGYTEPYLVTSPTESAFVPDQMLKLYTDMLAGQQASGKYTAPALRAQPATGAVTQLHRYYDGKLQGMQLLVNLGAPGSHSPWVQQ